MEIGETLLVHTAAEWREWLAQNHATKKEIWLIYYKKTSGKTGITYEESVEQALCFGWIDGAIKGIDKDTYAGRFTPRRAKSPWSESNRERVARLISDGRMMEAGMIVLPEDLRVVLIHEHRRLSQIVKYLETIMLNQAPVIQDTVIGDFLTRSVKAIFHVITLHRIYSFGSDDSSSPQSFTIVSVL